MTDLYHFIAVLMLVSLVGVVRIVRRQSAHLLFLITRVGVTQDLLNRALSELPEETRGRIFKESLAAHIEAMHNENT